MPKKFRKGRSTRDQRAIAQTDQEFRDYVTGTQKLTARERQEHDVLMRVLLGAPSSGGDAA